MIAQESALAKVLLMYVVWCHSIKTYKDDFLNKQEYFLIWWGMLLNEPRGDIDHYFNN